MKRINNSFLITDTFAIKGIAIIMMYFHHMFLDYKRWGGNAIEFWPLSQNFTVSIASFFKICVAIFVFLTAYGLTINYKNKIYASNNVKSIAIKYILNRIYKLEINFLFVFILTLAYSFIMGIGHYSRIYGNGTRSLYRCLLDGLGLAELFKTPTMNGTWWYMSLAIVLIILFPILFDILKRYGITFIVALLVLPLALNLPYSHLNRYLPCMALGIYFADTDLICRISRYLMKDCVIKKCILLTLVITCIVVVGSSCKKYFSYRLIPFFDMTISSSIIVWAYTYFKNTWSWELLQFLGRHSLNMFLTHTLIRHYWYHDFTYSFYYAWIDLAVLFIITIILSIFIENIKTISGYKKLLEYKFL